jgi:hypothetical protein
MDDADELFRRARVCGHPAALKSPDSRLRGNDRVFAVAAGRSQFGNNTVAVPSSRCHFPVNGAR